MPSFKKFWPFLYFVKDIRDTFLNGRFCWSFIVPYPKRLLWRNALVLSESYIAKLNTMRFVCT